MLKFRKIVIKQPRPESEPDPSKSPYGSDAGFCQHDAFAWHDVLLLPFSSGKLCSGISRKEWALPALCWALDIAIEKSEQNSIERQQLSNEIQSSLFTTLPIPTISGLNLSQSSCPKYQPIPSPSSVRNQVRIALQGQTEIFWLGKKLWVHHTRRWRVRLICAFWWFVQGRDY